MDSTRKRPARQPVLVLARPDGTIEIFAENHIDFCVARVPVANSIEAERMAEAVADLLLPRRYRGLWQADKLRKIATTRPLLPSALADSIAVRACIDALNSTPREKTKGGAAS